MIFTRANGVTSITDKKMNELDCFAKTVFTFLCHKTTLHIKVSVSSEVHDCITVVLIDNNTFDPQLIDENPLSSFHIIRYVPETDQDRKTVEMFLKNEILKKALFEIAVKKWCLDKDLFTT